MGQFINSDCNTWKVSRPSPQCYFMAAHKSRPGSTTAAIKINTAAANTVIGEEPSGQSAANSCHNKALSAVCRQRVPEEAAPSARELRLGAARSPLLAEYYRSSEESFNVTPALPLHTPQH